MWKLIVLSVFFSLNAQCKVILPEIFYASSVDQLKYCENEGYQNEPHWRELLSEKIDREFLGETEISQNVAVTLSYLELFHLSKDQNAAFMGYVYANASHHLGRLVRFTAWPLNHPLRALDQSLVRGPILRLLTRGANHDLSKRLMAYSLALYKELSWGLGALSLCGKEYTLRMVSDRHLRRALQSVSLEDFMSHFVTYEQSYLQRTMYQDLLISTAARSKVLDEMRFISFNGEEHESFAHWCKRKDCGTSSFDLRNRIHFDVTSIVEELQKTQAAKEQLEDRAENAQIRATAYFFMEN